MGTGASSATLLETPGGDLRLPVSKLRFSVNQLRNLNSNVETLFEEDQRAKMSMELESTVESLIQKIVDGAGQKDPRFRCCHLIALHSEKKMRSRSLEYLVVLDSLPPLNGESEECRLVDGPLGYGRVRLEGSEAERWAEFLTPCRHLCRDKLVSRWVELIASCTSARGGGGTRALSTRAAARAAPYHYCYLQRSSPPPAPAHGRLAIVSGPSWVTVRVGSGDAQAKLLLALRARGGSSHAYTGRVPMTDPMALLHYTAGQMPYYAVAVPPPSGPPPRGATWQLWHPALEASLDSHCAAASPLGKLAGALNVLLDKMREGVYEGSLRAVSRYSVSCLLRRRLARLAHFPRASSRGLVSSHMSHHLLMVLDSLLALCEYGGTAGYVYPVERSSLIRRQALEQDWSTDADCVRSCLMALKETASEANVPPTPTEALETALFNRWEHLTKEVVPAGTPPHYTKKQIKYLWRVINELLKVKNMATLDENNPSLSTFRRNLLHLTSHHQEDVEDLIYVLAIVLDQAREAYMEKLMEDNKDFSKEISAYRTKKLNKLRSYYDISSAALVDAARRDPELGLRDLKDRFVFIKSLLLWLYKGVKQDNKYLGPVLKPFLDQLYSVSKENCWFVDEFYSNQCRSEFEDLKSFCLDVHSGKLDPNRGLLEAAKKMKWAKAIVDFVDRYRHIDFNLILPTGLGFALCHHVKLPSRSEDHGARSLTLNRRDKDDAKNRLAQRAVVVAFSSVLCCGNRPKPPMTRQPSSDAILENIRSGHYWKNSKPDVIPNSTLDRNALTQPRKPRKHRPLSSPSFPEVSKISDSKSMKKKYSTLRNLVYKEPMQELQELRRPKSAGSSLRKKSYTKPSLVETLDFINGVRDSLYVEESCVSDTEETSWSVEEDWLVSRRAPLNVVQRGGECAHWAAGQHVLALLHRGSFTILQELCAWLGEDGEGALFALHRLARTARSKSSERATTVWSIPPCPGGGTQRYRARPADHASGDEGPQPPPLPRHYTHTHTNDESLKRYSGLLADQLQDIENHLVQLETAKSKLNLSKSLSFYSNQSCTGIINPIYDIKIPKDKFKVKRSRSLGRTNSSRSDKSTISSLGSSLSLGRKSGSRVNDVLQAIDGISGETAIEPKNNGFYDYFSTPEVVCDSYRTYKPNIE